MEDDKLSDVVPSNIVSRQVMSTGCGPVTLPNVVPQESEGPESEYAEDVEAMEVDELDGEDEAAKVRPVACRAA